jgi:hypothetical protein
VDVSGTGSGDSARFAGTQARVAETPDAEARKDTGDEVRDETQQQLTGIQGQNRDVLVEKTTICGCGLAGQVSVHTTY